MSYACRGFRFAGVVAGIKHEKVPDVGLMVCDGAATAAAVFTKNRVVAAPVRVSKRALSRSGGTASAVVVNSGNANACTGPRGAADARDMAARAASELGLSRDSVLVASTGVIGVPLPMERVDAGIADAVAGLRKDGFERFARAILTTDRGPKLARRTLRIAGRRVTLIGCTKGAGMIAPNMATTLSFVATDARLGARDLDRCLHEAVDVSFNAISVDGDTSTNDMALVMAGGASNRQALSRSEIRAFGDSLADLFDELARKLMRDGEGVHHVVTVAVQGARSKQHAQKVAQTIANSPLVKTAIAGKDPNWGRILGAAGRAGVPLSERRLSLWIGDVPIVVRGVPAGGQTERRAGAVMKRREYVMVLDLGAGSETAHYLACDLSHEYVSINADYRT